MTESAHELIAAKAARLRELSRLAGSDADDTRGDAATPARDDVDEIPSRPSWSGGWAN